MDLERIDLPLKGKVLKAFDKIQKQIQFCDSCQPYEGGSSFWLFGKPMELDDLFFTHLIDNKYWDQIIDNLQCPNCRNREFNLASIVGVKHDFEIAFDRMVDRALKSHKKEITDFHSVLIHTPFLSLKHKLAKRIRKQLQSFPVNPISVSGTFYRARNMESVAKYGTEGMLHLGHYSGEGRFNHSGQNHLYISHEEYTAIDEVTYDPKTTKDKAWLQKLEIATPIDKILDLTYEYDNVKSETPPLFVALFYSDSLVNKSGNIEQWKPAYLVSRFIMDCAKDAGYNGIEYNSARHMTGRNVVLFDKLDEVKPFNDPYEIDRAERTKKANDKIMDI